MAHILFYDWGNLCSWICTDWLFCFFRNPVSSSVPCCSHAMGSVPQLYRISSQFFVLPYPPCFPLLFCACPSVDSGPEGSCRRILDSCRQLTSLTGNILLLSKLENRKIVPEKQRFSLDEQLRQCILSMEPLWTQKNLFLDIELQEIQYEGNESMMAQVWTNLLSNAIKFTPDSGSIHIRLNASMDSIFVTFTDSGIGMTQEEQRHIFDKFYQADHSRSVQGNGLGLTLVQRIICLCGGKIQVSSRQEKGTTFTVSLPAVCPQ